MRGHRVNENICRGLRLLGIPTPAALQPQGSAMGDHATESLPHEAEMLRFSMTERGAEARRAPLAPRLLLGISIGGLHAHMAARPHAHGVNGYAHWDMITGEKEAAGDGLSVCEQLELEGSSHVGRATVFVIWNLGTPVATLIGALEDYVASRGLDRARTFFWISNLMLRRGSKQQLDHDLATLDCFLRPIEAIGRTAFLLHPWGADAFRRLWSLWELYLSHHSCAGLELLCPPSVAKQLGAFDEHAVQIVSHDQGGKIASYGYPSRVFPVDCTQEDVGGELLHGHEPH